MRIKFTALALVLGFCFVPVRAIAQKIEIKNGVRLVHNEKVGVWGETARVRLELVRKIGGSDVDDEHFAFKDPAGVAVDSKGGLYILDRGNERIQKFSPDGKFLRTIGRHGQGPAEFQFPFSLTISPDDKLYVMDFHNRRIQILTPEGRMEKSIRLKGSPMSIVRILKSGDLVLGGRLHIGELMAARGRPLDLLSIFDLKGKVLKSFGEFIDYGDLNVNSEVHWFELVVDENDNIYLSFWYQNRVEKYSSDGTLSWRADRILNYGTEVIDKGYITKKGGSQAPKLNFVSSGLAVDKDGRIWVITKQRQLTPEERRITITTTGGYRRTTNPIKEAKDVNKFEIFDSEGILLGEIPTSLYAGGLRISGESLFVIDYEEAAVFQFRIVDN